MKFNYQARTKAGDFREGTVEATSREAAVTLLQGYGLYLTNLEKVESGTLNTQIDLFQKASAKDLVVFSRQLSIMFKSEVPLVESLRTLAAQTKKQAFKEKILKISERIEGGAPFSQAISSYPKLFNQFFVNIVRAGESSGKLSDSLGYLANHLEREYYLKEKIKGAMIYPALILVMTIGILFMMSFFVIPKLIDILQETGQELPLLTRVVIFTTDFARSWAGIVLYIVIGAGMFALFRYSKTKEGKARTDRTLLKIPILGSFLKLVYLSRFAENLSTLIIGGLPIAKSLEISGSVVGNDVYKEVIERTTDEVKKGEKISSVLERHPDLFPAMFSTMILIGEKTGTLDNTLMNLVNFYREEIERGIEALLKIIEPLLIVIMGGLVGLMVGSILLPLYQTMVSI